MRFCSKVDCTCTLATCYSIKNDNGDIIITSTESGEGFQFTPSHFSQILESRSLDLENNTFSTNVYSKLRDWLDRQ